MTPKVIIIRETMLEGIVNDLSMASVFVILIGLGAYLDSTAMQWAGFVFAWVFVAAKAMGSSRKNPPMTIAQARSLLATLEAQSKGEDGAP